MDIDVSIGKESLTISIDNPHKFDVAGVVEKILNFGSSFGVRLDNLQIESLIPKMVRGVAGCEGGCPSDAKGFVRSGFNGFDLSYIEGGILSAVHSHETGNQISLKIFPEFD